MDSFVPRITTFWEGRSPGGWREARRMIYDTELVFTTEGTFRLEIEEKVLLMRAGSLALIPPAVWHESWTQPGVTAMRHCVHFLWSAVAPRQRYQLQALEGERYHSEWTQPVPVDVRLQLPLIAHQAETGPIRDIIDLFFFKLRNDESPAPLLLWPVLRHLLSAFHEHTDHEISGKSRRSVYAVKDYIDSHYSSPISYEDFCQITRISKSHLCKIFHETIGMSPNQYLNAVRILHAKRLLKETNGNISEVARQVGIGDLNYFSRLFRKKTGGSPSEYLRQD